MSSKKSDVKSTNPLGFRVAKSAQIEVGPSKAKGSTKPVDKRAEPDIVVVEESTRSTKRIESKKRQREPETEVFLPRNVFKTVIYTSSKDDQKQADEQNEAYGPNPKKKFLAYKHKNDVLKFVLKSYAIPKDFEISNKYGALSGSCYEERVVVNYMNGNLKQKECDKVQCPVPVEMKMCYECGEMGHFPTECDTLFES